MPLCLVCTLATTDAQAHTHIDRSMLTRRHFLDLFQIWMSGSPRCGVRREFTIHSTSSVWMLHTRCWWQKRGSPYVRRRGSMRHCAPQQRTPTPRWVCFKFKHKLELAGIAASRANTRCIELCRSQGTQISRSCDYSPRDRSSNRVSPKHKK